MTGKRRFVGRRAARYAGKCHFPRVVPETGLLRVLGWTAKRVRPKTGATVTTTGKPQSEQAAAPGK